MFNLINLQKKEIYFGGISDEHFARKEKKSCLLDQRLSPFRLNLVSFKTCHCYSYGKKK